MHWGVLAAFIAVIAAYVLMNRHVLGYQIRLAGAGAARGRFAGVDPNRLVLLCLGISGALAGAAGLFEVSGPAGQISIDFNVGYGFTAIIVAFLGRLHPIGILLAGLLMALTYIGGELAQLMLGIPAPAIQAFQGMLLFFLLALDVLSKLPHPPETDGGGLMLIDPVTLVVALIIASTPVPSGRHRGTGGGKDRRPEPRGRGHDDCWRRHGVHRRGGNRIRHAGVSRRHGGRPWCCRPCFAILTQVLLSNQVATGLALTLVRDRPRRTAGCRLPGLHPRRGFPTSSRKRCRTSPSPGRSFFLFGHSANDLPRGHAGRHGVVCSPAPRAPA